MASELINWAVSSMLNPEKLCFLMAGFLNELRNVWYSATKADPKPGYPLQD